MSISFGSLDNGTTFCEESVPPAFFRTAQGINQTLIALNLPWLDNFTQYLAQYEFKFTLEGGSLTVDVENATLATPSCCPEGDRLFLDLGENSLIRGSAGGEWTQLSESVVSDNGEEFRMLFRQARNTNYTLVKE